MNQAEHDRRPMGPLALLFAALFYLASCLLMAWLFLDLFNLGDLIR
jgi:hypothetical protein|tara:strand:- start:3476 stop:3613 length:138 start_codon:yes stop_codon:yes gene_type:complete